MVGFVGVHIGSTQSGEKKPLGCRPALCSFTNAPNGIQGVAVNDQKDVRTCNFGGKFFSRNDFFLEKL
jgi:hypothetical protein